MSSIFRHVLGQKPDYRLSSFKAPLGVILLLAVFVACGKKDSKKNLIPDPKKEFTLDDSKFCGGPIDPSKEKPADPTPPYKFPKSLLTEKLSVGGLTGWIHGAANSYSTYTFTYRSEDSNDEMAFFKSEQFSLLGANSEVKDVLKTLNRHDKVKLFGSILENQSPLVHIKIDRLEVLERYPLALKNEYKFDPTPFLEKGTFEILGQVHAYVNSEARGGALILDWKDLLIPIAVPQDFLSLSKDLIRGDVVKVSVKVVSSSQSTKHFTLDSEAPKPLQVIDSLRRCHGQERTIEGYLVKFDRSPAISTDVYAIRVEDLNGIARNFTLFPGTQDAQEFMRIFRAVSAGAKAAWAEDLSPQMVIRNFSSKKGTWIKATGKINVVSSEQANAQIYLDAPEKVTYRKVP
jgi:hypothetical protein